MRGTEGYVIMIVLIMSFLNSFSLHTYYYNYRAEKYYIKPMILMYLLIKIV